MKKLITALLLLSLVLSVFAGCEYNISGEQDETEQDPSEMMDEKEAEEKYNLAFSLVEEEKYEEAYKLFEELGKYKNANEELKKFYSVLIGITDRDATTSVALNENNLPEQLITTIDGRIYTNDYLYDDDGRLIECKSKGPYGGEPSINQFIYNTQGQLITEIINDGNVCENNYTYDESGNRIKKVQINVDGSEYITEYTYDKNGNVLKIVENRYITEYIYNKDGKVLQETITSSTGYIDVLSYNYDEMGMLIQTRRFEHDGSISSITDYTYDENGNNIKIVCTLPDGKTSVCENDYDQHGNVIKEISTNQNGEVHIHEREYAFVYIPFELTKETKDWLDIR